MNVNRDVAHPPVAVPAVIPCGYHESSRKATLGEYTRDLSLASARIITPWARGISAQALLIAGLGGLLVAHLYTLRHPWDQPNPLALPAHMFSLVLLAAMLWLSAALGVWGLRRLGLGQTLDLETTLFGVGLGLGGLAYLVLACGLLGVLQPWVLGGIMAVLAVAARAELRELLAALPLLAAAVMEQCRALWREPGLRLALPLAELCVLLLIVRALAPPTGYDALLYHLAAPREFLRLGHIAPLPELPQANFPFTAQMLYLLGLAFGSDELANLLHLGMALLTALAAYGFGRRFFAIRVGWLAGLIFLSAPALAVYGPNANIDYVWAYFDFLAVFGFALWMGTRQSGWLVVAGLFGGLSLGSKYLGVLTCSAIGLGVLLEAVRTERARLTRVVGLLALFAAPAALTAAPWYLKNWIWLGSPVWPFLSPDVPDVVGYYGRNMNSGRGLADYLMLPLRLYIGGAVELPAAVPPLLFLILPLYVLVKKDRLITYLLGIAGLHFLVWSQGIQTLRYLFPIFPAVSVVVAFTLDAGMANAGLRQPARSLLRSLPAVSMALGAGAAIVAFVLLQPVSQLLGLQSREAYLTGSLHDYAALRYLNDHRSEIDRLLVVGDARVFYIDAPVIVDQGLELATELLPPDPEVAAARLRQAGISHVLVSQGHLAWLANYDPEQRVKEWWTGFQLTRSEYLVPRVEYEVTSVYSLSSAGPQKAEP